MIAGLPECMAPATQRIEAYRSTPGGGLHGSLDASVYVCEAHAQAAAEAITAAGLVPFRANSIRDGLTCGQVSDYTTMQLATVPAGVVAHPVWCDLSLCTVTGEAGEHRSRPVDANPRDEQPLAVARVWLEAVPENADGATGPAGTFVLVDLEQSGERHVFLFGAGQARALGRVLRRLSEMAAAGAR